MSRDPKSASAPEVVEAVKRATRDFNLCRNRVWAVARSHPRGEQILSSLIPSTDEIQKKEGKNEHEQCTFDFCEQSRLDFTSVAQRHEEPCKTCTPLQNLF